ncbi:MAG TPA: hypothetical protein VMU02_00520, partial [bacterium]|nr:hypothetical protein [bacterium]
ESRLQLIAAAESANMIVQRAKEQDVRIEELKNLARQMRGQLAVIINGLDWDLTKLEGWEFGKYFRTVGPEKPGPSALDQK